MLELILAIIVCQYLFVLGCAEHSVSYSSCVCMSVCVAVELRVVSKRLNISSDFTV